MSEILTGPDRGPPAFDWRKECGRLAQENTQLLEALKGILEFALSYSEYQAGIGNKPFASEIYARVRIARSVIAKAESK